METVNALQIHRLRDPGTLSRLASEIASAGWDDANEMGDYDAESLAAFITDPRRILLIAKRDDQLIGIASASIQLKPYADKSWLYVDEVDVVPSGRQQGVGTALMNELLQIAKANDCVEMWLGTETDNRPAQKLYESLQPDQVESFVGFTWRIQ